ncbi:MAG: DUF5683 domain-containing protein [Flavobacteriaceae bacterium]
MSVRNFILVFSFFCLTSTLFAQKDTVNVKGTKVVGQLKIDDVQYNPLAPAKAAFYSAIFPGAGQIYNKKYWKAPIVWGGMAFTTYLYIDNNREYKRYRNAFKIREAGGVDEFKDLISRDGLINAQKVLKNNRDLSLLSTVLIYVLQIVEASVNAHLLQFNTSDNLTFEPNIVTDPINYTPPKVGVTLTYSF